MATSSPAHSAYANYSAKDARVDLAAAHRLSVRDNLHEGTWNHLSLVVPGSPDRILITPGHKHWSRVRASDLVELGPEADPDDLKHDEAQWVGYRIHYPLHMARPDAACVLHAHPPYATALTIVEGGRLEMAEQNALEFHEQVGYNDEYDAGIPVGMDQGEAMAEALGERNCVLFLKNHGVVVVGATVAIAYTRLYVLERYCRVQAIAKSYGQPLALIPEHRRNGAGDGYKEDHFAAMKDLLDELEPDYRD
jgi:ribulose-5-phosphate 4-epimerase/fuculose-1-phosphate aldolase